MAILFGENKSGSIKNYAKVIKDFSKLLSLIKIIRINIDDLHEIEIFQ
ncbi:MAG: hypothetical protein QXX95_05355 [Nitrososphaerales archaeon]